MNRLQILLYVYETVRRVPCSYRRQLLLFRKAYGFADAFFQENPGAGRAGLTAAFGEPADFALSLLEYVDKNERTAEFRRKSWTRRAIVLCVGCAALLTGILCAFYTGRAKQEDPCPRRSRPPKNV